ncbi:Uncharacterised protein [Staphylococcus argenteus]|nr:hypothetical protein SAMSHR1132_20420 [Staphylococcus argenteus]SUJ23261.1 Uncharacterised protein [Staphylococcus argenteus]
MQCKRRGNKEFTEATQYMKVKKSKLSLNRSDIKYIFCKKCGLVKDLEVLNPQTFE